DVTILAVQSPGLPGREERYGFTVERIPAAGRWYARAKARATAPTHSAPASQGAPTYGAAPRPAGRARRLAIKAARTFNVAMFCRNAARRAIALQADVVHCHDFDTLLA